MSIKSSTPFVLQSRGASSMWSDDVLGHLANTLVIVARRYEPLAPAGLAARREHLPTAALGKTVIRAMFIEDRHRVLVGFTRSTARARILRHRPAHLIVPDVVRRPRGTGHVFGLNAHAPSIEHNIHDGRRCRINVVRLAARQRIADRFVQLDVHSVKDEMRRNLNEELFRLIRLVQRAGVANALQPPPDRD